MISKWAIRLPAGKDPSGRAARACPARDAAARDQAITGNATGSRMATKPGANSPPRVSSSSRRWQVAQRPT